jgi:hypothetical protein
VVTQRVVSSDRVGPMLGGGSLKFDKNCAQPQCECSGGGMQVVVALRMSAEGESQGGGAA